MKIHYFTSDEENLLGEKYLRVTSCSIFCQSKLIRLDDRKTLWRMRIVLRSIMSDGWER